MRTVAVWDAIGWAEHQSYRQVYGHLRNLARRKFLSLGHARGCALWSPAPLYDLAIEQGLLDGASLRPGWAPRADDP